MGTLNACMCMRVCLCVCVLGDQRSTCRSDFSPSIFWTLGIKLRLLGMALMPLSMELLLWPYRVVVLNALCFRRQVLSHNLVFSV